MPQPGRSTSSPKRMPSDPSGTTYFGEGQSGERTFAAFSQNMIQWKAFGDNRAYDMMQRRGGTAFPAQRL